MFDMVCVSQEGLFLADSERLWNGEVLPDVCRGCHRPLRVELLLLKMCPCPPQTQLTSLCGAQGQLVMFIASASDQSPQHPKERGSEWEEGRKRKRDRQMGEASRVRKKGGLNYSENEYIQSS